MKKMLNVLESSIFTGISVGMTIFGIWLIIQDQAYELNIFQCMLWGGVIGCLALFDLIVWTIELIDDVNNLQERA